MVGKVRIRWSVVEVVDDEWSLEPRFHVLNFDDTWCGVVE